MGAKKISPYPEMALVKQALLSAEIKDIRTDLFSTLSNFHKSINPGQTVAVAVGSRGIDKIDTVVYHVVQYLKNKGLKPFIIPAMGSHGGASAEGQKNVLAKLGITEASMEAEIIPDMNAVLIGKLPCGLRVYFSEKALEADKIVIVNRIKPHTKFNAEIESGICKMMTIGLGKAQGATEFHSFAVNHSFAIIEEAAKLIVEKCNIDMGLALIEDGNGKLSRVEAIPPKKIIDREKELLKDATHMMGRIPIDPVDVLVVDYIGKDISGIGMDSNVTGRHRDIVGDFFTAPHVKRIFVRDLSPLSDGNGNGIGLADVTTKRLVDAIDMKKTYINAITAISLEKAAIPMHFNTDQEALEACLSTIGIDSWDKARIVRIRDTKNLNLIQVSKSLESEIESNRYLERVSPWTPFQFDEKGNLYKFPCS